MAEPVLSTHKVTKSFGALKASDAVSIDVLPGEIHAVIGPNGAGKSTLVAQICGAIQPDAGHVNLQGQDVTHLPVSSRARAGIGRTFQISDLAIEDTVLQNVMLAVLGATQHPWQFWKPVLRRAEIVTSAQAALERVGLGDVQGMMVSELSHGQRRRLEVAIALAMDPVVFIMDEPMAGLGAEGTRELTGLLDGLRQEAPILLIEHDMDAVFALADRISVLVSGSVIATGSVTEIRNNQMVQDAYLGGVAS